MSRYFPCIEQRNFLLTCLQCLNESSDQDEINGFVSTFHQYMQSVLREYSKNIFAGVFPELEEMRDYCEKFEIEVELGSLEYHFIKNYWDCFERERSRLQKKLEQSTSMLTSSKRQLDEEVGIRPCR